MKCIFLAQFRFGTTLLGLHPRVVPSSMEFVAIDFGSATLDNISLLGEVPPNPGPDRYLQQSLCSVSCEVFTPC